MNCRYEKLREGIVDFEKLRIIREKAARSTNKDVMNLMRELDDHLKIFLAEKDFLTGKIKTDVDKGRALIEEISNKL